MHIVFMEKVHTRTRGKLAQKYLDKYKSTWLKGIRSPSGIHQEIRKSSKGCLQGKGCFT